uniref:DUF4157 domain-containing protein n=1 Tax=Ignisphaera aggregans TaxID=334771 RepID=A0A7J2U303_9CREN
MDKDSLVLVLILEFIVISAFVAVYIGYTYVGGGGGVTTTTTYSKRYEEILSLARDVEMGVERIRNLSFTSGVRFELVNTSWALEQWAPKEGATSVPPDLVYKEVVYKATLLLPLNFSIVSGERSFIGMFLAATAGTTIYINTDYFDPRSPGARNVLAHELTHVLQFIHFPKIFSGEETTDSELAKQALIEGDAGFTQHLYCVLTKLCTPSPKTQIDLENTYIALVTFPYVYGEYFISYLYNYSNNWNIVNEAYGKPPLSTSMVIHPEKYLQYLLKGSPGFEEPVIRCRAQGEATYSDRLGEYYIMLVLAQRIGIENAMRVAEEWRGDRVELYKIENATHITWTICWNTTWNTEKASQEFYTNLVQNLKNMGTKITKNNSEAQLMIEQNTQQLYTKIICNRTWVAIISTLTTQKH